MRTILISEMGQDGTTYGHVGKYGEVIIGGDFPDGVIEAIEEAIEAGQLEGEAAGWTYEVKTMRTETKERIVRITWVFRGTNNAAMIGYDDEFTSDSTEAEIIQDCLHFAVSVGIDTEKYEPIVEEIA